MNAAAFQRRYFNKMNYIIIKQNFSAYLHRVKLSLFVYIIFSSVLLFFFFLFCAPVSLTSFFVYNSSQHHIVITQMNSFHCSGYFILHLLPDVFRRLLMVCWVFLFFSVMFITCFTWSLMATWNDVIGFFFHSFTLQMLDNFQFTVQHNEKKKKLNDSLS